MAWYVGVYESVMQNPSCIWHVDPVLIQISLTDLTYSCRRFARVYSVVDPVTLAMQVYHSAVTAKASGSCRPLHVCLLDVAISTGVAV